MVELMITKLDIDMFKSWNEALHPRDTKGRFTVKLNITDEVYQSTIENGGVTINIKGEKPSQGYVFALEKETEKVIPQNEFSPKHIEEYIKRYKKKLKSKGAHLGTWVDEGNVYLDVSYVGEPSEKTIKMAEKAGQLAVFDLGTFQTVYTSLKKSLRGSKKWLTGQIKRGLSV